MTGPRVLVWPADDGGSGHYRLRYPADAMAAAGHDVRVDTAGPMILWDRRWQGTDPPSHVQVMGLAQPPDADVVVIQRPARRWWADIIPHLQLAGVSVVVDVDDRFDRIPLGNKAHAHYAPNRLRVLRFSSSGATVPLGQDHPHHTWEFVHRACRRADLVTATTASLAEAYGYGHAAVLPNLVPDWYRYAEPAQRLHAVGWTGSLETHPGDLESTRGAIGRALQGSGWGFHVVGTGDGVQAALGLHGEPTTTGDWVPFADYPYRMAEIGVGVVPLVDSVFNAGKSALKMAEFAALGVPVVASPTPDNRRLARHGVGLLAASPGQWQRHLRQLLYNDDYRLTLAEQGRAAMAGHTYERWADRWYRTWTSRLRTRTAP